jgi:hypothetical protein
MKAFNPQPYEGDFDPIKVIEHYATQAGYSTNCGWGWSGPVFKPADQYITEDGWILGTTVWYVLLEWRGRYWSIYGDTFTEAVQNAHLLILEALPITNMSHEQGEEILNRLGHRNK